MAQHLRLFIWTVAVIPVFLCDINHSISSRVSFYLNAKLNHNNSESGSFVFYLELELLVGRVTLHGGNRL